MSKLGELKAAYAKATAYADAWEPTDVALFMQLSHDLTPALILAAEALDLVQRAWVGDGVDMATAVDAVLIAQKELEMAGCDLSDHDMFRCTKCNALGGIDGSVQTDAGLVCEFCSGS